MCPHSPLTLTTIPTDILAVIALEVALLDALGPPAHLVPLLMTCKRLNAALSFHNCLHLYARIFRCKFDWRAAQRRMGVRATYSSHQAWQLKKCSIALKRLRTTDIYSDHLTADLWTAFIMCTENDGKNTAQLDWAGLDAVLDEFMRTRLWEDRERSNGWPAESTINALAIWLVWLRMTPDKLAAMTGQQCKLLLDLTRPYVLTALRYPSFHAPDNHFWFPLPEELNNEFPFALTTPHGFYPLYREPSVLVETFHHFGLRLDICAPLIAQGAKLLYMTLSDVPFSIDPGLPVDRAHALQLGRTHVSLTQADLREANAHKSVQLVERGEWDWRAQLAEDAGRLEDDGVWRKGLKSKSARFDNDWNRLTGCLNPWRVPALKGVVYTYGTMDGLWQGRLLIPDLNQYFGLVTSTNFPTNFSDQNPRLATVPVYMRLREHHCINPQLPVLSGSEPDEFDDGIRNAWFPTIQYREANGVVRIEDQTNNEVTHYETYVEGRANSHSEETCTQCRHRRLEEEEELQERVRENARAASAEAEGESTPAMTRHRLSALCSPGPSPSRVHAEASPNAAVSEAALDAEQARARMDVDAALGPSMDVDELLDSVMGETSSEGSDDLERLRESDEEEEEEEYIVHTCNGIVDIIVTGETLPRHAQAWYDFRFYGRIRRWDGLVAIVRVPVHNPHLGVFIFRGYVVANRNFVGSWRAFTNNVHAIPLEGPFVMSKV
ncbi:hypothetical protein AcV5_005355 [Taiwanofungus camphoratus]|nr:hypothetical protein AcV5_005355 [Antrodia cinnamomea]